MNVNYLSVGAQHRLLNGLMEYWKFDDAVTGTAVASHNSHDLTCNNVTQNTDAKISKGVYFPSTQNQEQLQATITGDSSIMPFYDKFSISLWVWVDTLPTVKGAAARLFEYAMNVSPYQYNRIYISSSTDKVVMACSDQALNTYTAISTDAVVVDTWYHIVGVCYGGGSNIKIFVNNVSTDGTPAFSGSLYKTSLTNYIRLGSPAADNASVHGIMDEVGIWNRALTTEEITALYNSGSGLTYPFS